jgi:hypothetical protein
MLSNEFHRFCLAEANAIASFDNGLRVDLVDQTESAKFLRFVRSNAEAEQVCSLISY